METVLPDYALEVGAHTYPFRYPDDERPDLAGGLVRQYPSDDLGPWAARFLTSSGSTTTMTLLHSMTRGIKEEFAYLRRSEKGVQSPGETLRLQSGSCRDFAVLMMEAVRSLGLAARFVSGYIFVPEANRPPPSAVDPRTAGCRRTCRAPDGSTSIPPTASSGIATSFVWPWRGISGTRCPCGARSSVPPRRSAAWRSMCSVVEETVGVR